MNNAGLQEVLANMSDYIRTQVATGFAVYDEIVPDAVEFFSDDCDADVLRPHVERILRESVEAHVKAQAAWPSVTDCDRLDAAFAELEKLGIVCRQNFSCCGTCAASEIWDEIEAERKKGREIIGCAHYNWQTTESAVEGDGVWLSYGSVVRGERASVDIGHKIADAMRAQGLEVTWNGSLDRRIHVALDWKRRLPESYTRRP